MDIPCHTYPCLKLLIRLIEEKPKRGDYSDLPYHVVKKGMDDIFRYFKSYNSSVARTHLEKREFYMGRIDSHLKQVKAYLETEIFDEASADSIIGKRL